MQLSKILTDRQKNKLNNARNSNIELLRIFAMFSIVLSHYTVFSSANPNEMNLCFNKFLLDSFGIGKLGVAIFVMITGYFMVESKFKIERIINIIIQTLFYSLSCFVIFCIVNKNFSIMGIINSLFPVIRQEYWFVTAYVLLSFLIPFINKAIIYITRKQFVALLAILVFYFSFAPTFLDFYAYENGGHLGYMIMFYCVGAYLKLYPNNVLSKKIASLTISSISFFLMIASVVIIDILGVKISVFAGREGKFLTVFSVLVLLCAVCSVSFFVNLKPRFSKIVNTIAACAFGVYLIHENNYVREWIWGTAFDNSQYADSKFLVLHLVISVILVYTGCTIIEYIRKFVIEKYILKRPLQMINKIVNSISIIFFQLFEKVVK